MDALSQYSDHEEDEEEEASAGTVGDMAGKKEEERVMRRSSVEGSEENKAGSLAFVRRKRRSTTEGESSAWRICVFRWWEQEKYRLMLFVSLHYTPATRSPCHSSSWADVVCLKAASVSLLCVSEPICPLHWYGPALITELNDLMHRALWKTRLYTHLVTVHLKHTWAHCHLETDSQIHV